MSHQRSSSIGFWTPPAVFPSPNIGLQFRVDCSPTWESLESATENVQWRRATKRESDVHNHSQTPFVDSTLQADRIIASIGSGQGVGHSDGTCKPQKCKRRTNPSGCGKRRQFSVVAHASTRSYHT